jgi:xylulokinase
LCDVRQLNEENNVGYVIGCDLGSQSVKAVMLDPDGTVLGVTSSHYDMSYPASGWAEQNPQDYCDGLAAAVRSLLETTGVKPEEVTHFGLDSQVDGVIPVDENLQPLHPAIIWLDRRAAKQSARIESQISSEDVFKITGLNIDATHTAPKIMWLADEKPEIMAKTRALCCVGAFGLAWLTGELAQDHSNASSTLLYDVTERKYSTKMAEITGIDLAKMPPILDSKTVVGHLRPEAAAALGLTTNCQVIVGCGDEHAATLGSGAIHPDIVVDISGTAEAVTVASPTPVIDSTRLVETHIHAYNDLYLIENPGFVSGGNTLWFGEDLMLSDQQKTFDLAAQSEPGAHGVRFIPALTGAMAPRWDDNMRGCFYGLSMNHTAADLARAVIEGNCFAFRDISDRMHELGLGGSTRIVGGGARCDFWLTEKATVTHAPVEHVLLEEPSATGAAMLASLAAGNCKDVDECVSATVCVDPNPIEPDESIAAVLDDAYGQYRALFDAIEPVASK